MTTIRTVRGYYINLEQPDPTSFHIEDIAHGLARVCRYSGQLPRFYSVLRHSDMVSRLAMQRHQSGGPGAELALVGLVGLLHDASEAYITDLPRPVKSLCGDYQMIEGRLQDAIEQQLIRVEIPEAVRIEVKRADRLAYDFERASFDRLGTMRPAFDRDVARFLERYDQLSAAVVN